MESEAKVLNYLNECGYAHSPRLIYSGYWGTQYINATDWIKGPESGFYYFDFISFIYLFKISTK
jgi:hypothetical protein